MQLQLPHLFILLSTSPSLLLHLPILTPQFLSFLFSLPRHPEVLCAPNQLSTPVAQAAATGERENKDSASCQLTAAANPLLTVRNKTQALPPGSEPLGENTFCYYFFSLSTKYIFTQRPTKADQASMKFLSQAKNTVEPNKLPNITTT